VVDIDLKAFFDQVNHDKLMNLVGRKIADKAILKLIGKYLRAPMERAKWTIRVPGRRGRDNRDRERSDSTPQGKGP
jgi:RNA-directed DNA polymerase